MKTCIHALSYRVIKEWNSVIRKWNCPSWKYAVIFDCVLWLCQIGVIPNSLTQPIHFLLNVLWPINFCLLGYLRNLIADQIHDHWNFVQHFTKIVHKIHSIKNICIQHRCFQLYYIKMANGHLVQMIGLNDNVLPLW